MGEILEEYIQHIKNTQNRSLLARIYGMFTIKTNYYEKVDIIIMQNTARLFNKHKKLEQFDLKGSLIGRRVKIRSINQIRKSLLKDMNFLELNNSKINK